MNEVAVLVALACYAPPPAPIGPPVPDAVHRALRGEPVAAAPAPAEISAALAAVAPMRKRRR